ncbi:hypothetical protein [Phenylobacterium sp.]|uniref:hypothetical protein n=1 Tax=Phenylobacterium sp. TaxID=1871053 RepID=UPI00120CC619|nr:hypothetical protein [Phenylobacterium sp.]THD73181.1 MAG: hypothetical protein E8A12_00210 [Phenylobacterium sp.]
MLVAFAVAAALSATSGPCQTVHGRIALWNGAPSVRIAVARTHRVLGVVQPNGSFDDLPPAVRAIWTGKEPDTDWAIEIEGDFKVCALTPDRPGHMQMVHLVKAAHLAPRPRR